MRADPPSTSPARTEPRVRQRLAGADRPRPPRRAGGPADDRCSIRCRRWTAAATTRGRPSSRSPSAPQRPAARPSAAAEVVHVRRARHDRAGAVLGRGRRRVRPGVRRLGLLRQPPRARHRRPRHRARPPVGSASPTWMTIPADRARAVLDDRPHVLRHDVLVGAAERRHLDAVQRRARPRSGTVPGCRRPGARRRRVAGARGDRHGVRRVLCRMRSRSARWLVPRRSCRAACCSSSSPRSAPTGCASSCRWRWSRAGVVATVLLRAHHAPGGIRPARGTPTRRLAGGRRTAAGRRACSPATSGQRLPGARAEPLFDTRGNGDGDGAELSPLVDIRSRLTNQQDTELIVVTVERRVVLAVDDAARVRRPHVGTGRPRRSASRGLRSDRRRPRRSDDPPAGPDRRPRRNMVPPRPIRSQRSGRPAGPVGYDLGTSTLTVDEELSNGDSFDDRVGATAFRSRRAGRGDLDRPGRPHLPRAPRRLPRRRRADRARGDRRTRPAPTRRRSPLQDWFKVGVHVQPRGPAGPREHRHRGVPARSGRLLRTVRRHLCRHDALARHSRRGSRSGFTTGEPIGGGRTRVAGRNAHAWPEVWFDGLGWVLFEPTPGAAPPAPRTTPASRPPRTPRPTTAAAAEASRRRPGDRRPTATDPLRPAPARLADEGPEPTAPATPLDADGDARRRAAGRTAPGSCSLLAPRPRSLRSSFGAIRRRAVGSRPNDEQLGLLWARSFDALRDVGVPIAASDTPTEIASAARPDVPGGVATDEVARRGAHRGHVPTRGIGRLRRAPARTASSRLRDGAHWTRQIERAVNESIGTARAGAPLLHRWQLIGHDRGTVRSAGGVVVDAARAASAEPRRDRELTEPLTAEQAEFGLEHERDDEHEHESGEREQEVQGQPTDGEREPADRVRATSSSDRRRDTR